MQTISHIDPINILLNNAKTKESYHLKIFKTIISKLYCYEIFKPMLDLVTTKALNGSLKFSIYDQKLFELDEGNCRTIEGSILNKIKNKIIVENNYLITIKKISSDVIIHEISHMIEKEIEGAIIDNFAKCVITDIEKAKKSNISLKSAVQQVMVREVEAYPENQKNSELFARYFQLLAMAKEVAGHTASYGYIIADIYEMFPRTRQWLWDNLYRSIIPKINIDIAKQSLLYIKKVEEIQHKWANEKVQSMHYKSSGKTKWSTSLKSIKDDPFQ